MKLLAATDVRKSYGSFQVLKGVSVDLQQGQIKVLVGPSGSGKSTFLRCLGLLEPLTAGKIEVEGCDCSWVSRRPGSNSGAYARALIQKRPKLAFVFQSFNLFPHLTAMGNVSLGPRVVRGLARREAEEIAKERLNLVGLGNRLHSYPHELSGGQQQRVAIARGLAMDPALLLLDEPTAALDAELTAEVLDVLLKLAERGVTMLAVTHALQFARRVATEVMVMDAGVLIETGTAEELFSRPKSARTRKFIETIHY